MKKCIFLFATLFLVAFVACDFPIDKKPLK